MAKSKKGNLVNNGKRENIERLKEGYKATQAKSAEEQWQELLSTMTEDEAKAFVAQVDCVAKEKEIKEREDTLEKIRTELTDLEEELNRRDEEQETLQEQINKRDTEVTDRESKVSAREKDAASRDVQLMARERDIIERENNAENGFAVQNSQALEILKKRRDELDGEIAELEQRKVNREKEIENYIGNLRSTMTQALDDEMESLRNSRNEEANKIIDNAKAVAKTQSATIVSEREELTGRASALDKQHNEQVKKEEELVIKEQELQFRENELNTEKADIPNQIKIGVERKSREIQIQLEQAKKDIAHYRARLEECEGEIADYKDREREANGLTMSALLEKLASAEEEKVSLQKKLDERPDDVIFAEYKVKAGKYDQLDARYVRLLEDNEDLKAQQAQWMLTTSQLETEREKCLVAEKRREVLEASIEKYEQEVNRFRSLYEQPKELAGRLESIEAPYFERRSMAELKISEIEWLNKIRVNCEQSGIKFNQRLLYSFHTALKTAEWSPLTVLAGVSGTGKSLLPEYYSRFGGIYFMSLAVQPDWDSPQSLFGYFNSVDNRFNATTLIRAMVQFSEKKEQAGKDTNLSDAMFIVLLDEMNLAHVELYFSDMLSKLERKRNTDGEVDIEIDLGAGMPKYPLALSDSILWVGTMNEDETTKSLSDKVLDRGNLISFPRPKEFVSRSKVITAEAAPMLPKEVWKSWLDSSVIGEKEFISRVEKYKKGLESINKAMEYAGRALGHRVWQSIENYMANHPKVIESIRTDDTHEFDSAACDRAMQEAFEEALVHKVMPKLRGIETDGETKVHCIDEIERVLFGQNGKDGLAPGLEADFKHATDNAYETFLWSSAMYLETEE